MEEHPVLNREGPSFDSRQPLQEFLSDMWGMSPMWPTAKEVAEKERVRQELLTKLQAERAEAERRATRLARVALCIAFLVVALVAALFRC